MMVFIQLKSILTNPTWLDISGNLVAENKKEKRTLHLPHPSHPAGPPTHPDS